MDLNHRPQHYECTGLLINTSVIPVSIAIYPYCGSIFCSVYAVQKYMKAILTQKFIDQLGSKEKRYKVYDTKLSGFFVLVHPTGRKGYFCFLRVNGKGTDFKIGNCDTLTLKQARDMGAEALMKARQGVSSVEERRIKDAETLKGFLDTRYKDYLISNHKAAKTSIWILEVVFKDFLNTRLEDIDINKIEKWRVKQSQTLKPSTMNRRTAALKAALSAARKWGIISNNPLADLSLKKIVKQPVQFLSDTQLMELRSVLKSRDDRMIQARSDYNEWLTARGKGALPDYDELECPHADHLTPLAILIMETGLRLSEALNLEWKHISDDFQSITVVSGKTGNYRVIPTTSDVQVYLKTLKRLNDANCEQRTNSVFVTTKGQPIKGVKTSWNGIRDKLSFNCDWRMLRRTFGSRLIKKGVSVYHVSQLLGHSNVSTTEEWYIGLDMESKRKAVGVLDLF